MKQIKLLYIEYKANKHGEAYQEWMLLIKDYNPIVINETSAKLLLMKHSRNYEIKNVDYGTIKEYTI